MTGCCNFCGRPAYYLALSQGNNHPMYRKRSYIYKICGKCSYTRQYMRGEVHNMIILRIKKEI